MTAAILSQDLLAICLLAGEGNLDKNLAEILSFLEKFQEKHDRHFGIGKDNLRTLFMLEYGMVKSSSQSNGKDIFARIAEQLHQIKLKEVAQQIINYHDVYFNDEGGAFISESEIGVMDSSSVSECYGYTPAEYAAKVKVKEAMREFFRKNVNYKPCRVRGFLKEHGIDQGLLFHCSRPGESS